MGRRRSTKQQVVGEAKSSGVASPVMAVAVTDEERRPIPVTVVGPDLLPITLTAQIDLQWPQDGRTHYYGPGKVQLPAEICERLRRLPHRVVAK